MVAKGEVGREEMDWEFGVSRLLIARDVMYNMINTISNVVL